VRENCASGWLPRVTPSAARVPLAKEKTPAGGSRPGRAVQDRTCRIGSDAARLGRVVLTIRQRRTREDPDDRGSCQGLYAPDGVYSEGCGAGPLSKSFPPYRRERALDLLLHRIEIERATQSGPTTRNVLHGMAVHEWLRFGSIQNRLPPQAPLHSNTAEGHWRSRLAHAKRPTEDGTRL
jgi:hypothetical protein